MKRSTKIRMILMSVLVSRVATAAEIECDDQQSRCVTYDGGLTIGDRVGVFNRDEQIVALGRVSAMDGDRRSVKIMKTYGKIVRNDQIALLSADVTSVKEVESRYEVVSPSSRYKAGVSAGLLGMAIGEYLSGAELSAHVQRRTFRDLALVVRTSILHTSGRIARNLETSGTETRTMNYNGFGIVPGVSYTLFEQNLISFRGEAGAGLIYSRSTIGGSEGLLEGAGFASEVTNGFGKLLRAAATMQVKMDTLRVDATVARSVVHSASASSVAFGISKDIN